MCLIFFSLHSHPRYKLIIAGNRDEFYNRRTAAAAFWEDRPDILGGRDLEACGTWMAMTRSGKISFVTNYRDPKNINPSAPSRGQLVSDYLENDSSPHAYIADIEKKAKTYNGFNLVVGNPEELYYLSNYGQGVEKIAPGFHGLSNHLLETPWPKVLRGKGKLSPLLNKQEINPEEVLNSLYDDQLAPDDKLPETGVGLDRERVLSSMFIKSPGYGSRCSTVVLIDYSNNVLFSERTYDPATFDHSAKTYQFKLEPASDNSV